VREHLRDAVGPPERGRAAAEVDGDQVAGIRVDAPVEFLDDRPCIALVGRLAELDREVAVRAQLAAPRKVQVNA
jgi:hypothetical protein